MPFTHLTRELRELNRSNSRHGFTLIELLAAAAIIGALVTLATPRYLAFVAKSRQAEAKNNLGTIHKLQEAYFLNKAALKSSGEYHDGLSYGVGAGKCDENDTAAWNSLGFRLSDCTNARYLYKTNSTTVSSGSAESENATKKIYPSCAKDDKWYITENGQLEQPTDGDVIQLCSN